MDWFLFYMLWEPFLTRWTYFDLELGKWILVIKNENGTDKVRWSFWTFDDKSNKISQNVQTLGGKNAELITKQKINNAVHKFYFTAKRLRRSQHLLLSSISQTLVLVLTYNFLISVRTDCYTILISVFQQSLAYHLSLSNVKSLVDISYHRSHRIVTFIVFAVVTVLAAPILTIPAPRFLSSSLKKKCYRHLWKSALFRRMAP